MKRHVIVLETIDYITEGSKYPLIEAEPVGYYIIDESGEETYYHSSSVKLAI